MMMTVDEKLYAYAKNQKDRNIDEKKLQQTIIKSKEASNINVVSEMVEMISIAREYESGQKVINAMDEMMSKMVSISEL